MLKVVVVYYLNNLLLSGSFSRTLFYKTCLKTQVSLHYSKMVCELPHDLVQFTFENNPKKTFSSYCGNNLFPYFNSTCTHGVIWCSKINWFVFPGSIHASNSKIILQGVLKWSWNRTVCKKCVWRSHINTKWRQLGLTFKYVPRSCCPVRNTSFARMND